MRLIPQARWAVIADEVVADMCTSLLHGTVETGRKNDQPDLPTIGTALRKINPNATPRQMCPLTASAAAR